MAGLGDLMSRVYPSKSPQDRAMLLAMAHWAQAVPGTVARNAMPVRLQHGVLTVHTSTAAWANTLQFEAESLLLQLKKRCPAAKLWYLEGNHEERLEKWIISSVMRHGKDAAFLRNLCGPEAVLHLEKRNIPYITKGRCHGGCRVQGTIKAGRVYVTHGTRHGKNAAAQMLQRFGASVVFGHVHKLMSVMDRNVHDGEIGAWSVGHLSRQQPLWRHGDCTD